MILSLAIVVRLAIGWPPALSQRSGNQSSAADVVVLHHTDFIEDIIGKTVQFPMTAIRP
jgi:hypothetical protein